MRSKLPNNVIDWSIRLSLGGVFVHAGLIKILDPARFASALGNYRLVPHDFINIIAILVPWIEAIVGFCIVVGVWLRPAALIGTFLMGVFLLVVASALARGLSVECGCFGASGGKSGPQNLALDFVLLCLAAVLVCRTGDRLSTRTTAD
jgi:putative oxidoreductase